jgi:hypothetical protein
MVSGIPALGITQNELLSCDTLLLRVQYVNLTAEWAVPCLELCLVVACYCHFPCACLCILFIRDKYILQPALLIGSPHPRYFILEKVTSTVNLWVYKSTSNLYRRCMWRSNLFLNRFSYKREKFSELNTETALFWCMTPCSLVAWKWRLRVSPKHCYSCTHMQRSTKGICSEKCVVRWFHHCVNCTYTNLDS